MKKICFIAVYIITCILLVGCWDYKEIDEVEIVLGIGVDSHITPAKEVDKISETQYLVTYEIVGIESEQGQLKSRVLKDKGNTLFRAIRKIIEKNGKRVYLAHTKILIISEELAKQGITEILDYTMRDAEYRPDVYVLITDNCNAEEMFKDDVTDVASMRLSDTLKNQNKIGTFESSTVWNIIDKMTKKGFEPAIPLISMDKDNQDGNLIHTVGGTAVFKASKMVGKLTEDETLYYLFIDNEIKNQPLSIQYYFEEKLGHISLEVLSNETKVTPMVYGESLGINITVDCNVAINELSNHIDILDEKDRNDVEKNAEKIIEEGIVDLITHVQKDYNSDMFGFGDLFKREKNKTWKKVEKDWDNIFQTLKITTDVNVKVESSALSSHPIEMDKY
ncbi:Ger(x)C family spore germination protein [Vallitalea sp.]|jgi:spore germination protein KC|uniref:Ger(x)C family spore germination protein n=1 Tax=Vallitalea sp. TaxID=1882829 RepID=UPI0025D26442|nr:Ger(x)C family spore germination protein [Vallitalea sp.]MCT4687821.1 Ger(x)C family spore germination protein [Vallitalea sp.]